MKTNIYEMKKDVLKHMKEHYKIHSTSGENLWFLKNDKKTIDRMSKELNK